MIEGKTEMFDYLTQNYGHIILNNDDDLQIENCKGDLAVTFGEKLDSEFVYNYLKLDDKLIIKVIIMNFDLVFMVILIFLI